MPKGPRQSRNPVEKLQSFAGQLDNIVQAIFESAEKPDFASSIVALKKQNEEEQSQKTNLNKDAREVTKLLQTYPGLSKQVVLSLRSKIAEYKALGVLDKYKAEPVPQEKAKRTPRHKAATPAAA